MNNKNEFLTYINPYNRAFRSFDMLNEVIKKFIKMVLSNNSNKKEYVEFKNVITKFFECDSKDENCFIDLFYKCSEEEQKKIIKGIVEETSKYNFYLVSLFVDKIFKYLDIEMVNYLSTLSVNGMSEMKFGDENKELDLSNIIIFLKFFKFMDNKISEEFLKIILNNEKKLLSLKDCNIIKNMARIVPDFDKKVIYEDMILRNGTTKDILDYYFDDNDVKSTKKIYDVLINKNDINGIINYIKESNYFDIAMLNNFDNESSKRIYDVIIRDEKLFKKLFIVDGKVKVEFIDRMLMCFLKNRDLESYYKLIKFNEDNIIRDAYYQEILTEKVKPFENNSKQRNLNYLANYAMFNNCILEDLLFNEKEFDMIKKLSLIHPYVSPGIIYNYLKRNNQINQLQEYLSLLKENISKYIYYEKSFKEEMPFERASEHYLEILDKRFINNKIDVKKNIKKD